MNASSNARFIAGGVLLLALGACGQVGPLYLPKDQAATVVPATPVSGDLAAPAPATGTPPAAEAPVDAGTSAVSTDGVGVGTDNRGTGGAAVPDRTNEPRRRAH